MTRSWVAADYPSKRRLSESEAMTVLKSGPDPKWFEPWITRGVLLPGVTEHKSMHGYIHVHGGTAEPFQYDVCMFWNQEGLSWGLAALHKDHSKCDECHGLYYFAPDEPLHLRMVVEADDSEDENDAEPEAGE